MVTEVDRGEVGGWAPTPKGGGGESARREGTNLFSCQIFLKRT